MNKITIKYLMLGFLIVAFVGCSKSIKPEARELCEKGVLFFDAGNNVDKMDTIQILRSMKCFDEAIKISPDYAEAYSRKGYCYHWLGKFDSAIIMYDKAIAIDSNYSPAWDNKGFLYYKQRDFQKAAEISEKGIKIDSNNPVALAHLAIIYSSMKKMNPELDYNDKILKYAERAYNISMQNEMMRKSDLMRIMNGLLQSYQAVEQNDKVIEVSDRMIAIGGMKSYILVNKALSLHKIGKLDEAISATKQAIELSPNNYTALGNLGSYYNSAKKYDSALIYLQQSIKIDSTNPITLENRGKTYMNMGKDYYPLAIADFNKAIALDKNKLRYKTYQTLIDRLTKKL